MTKQIFGRTLLMLALMASLAIVFSLHAQQQNSTPKIPFEKYVLPNGLQVILHVDRKLPIVNVNQWFRVGSANERLGRSGFAHLFEHMMFQGSKNAPGEFFSLLDAAGASRHDDEGNGRGVNGTTGLDRTNYFSTVPSGNLEYLLWIESDRLATLADTIDQAKLDGQKLVVANERRYRYENEPYGMARSFLASNIFPLGHPYHGATIGDEDDLTGATTDEVKAFFRRYYTPNNMSLVIAGDFEPSEAKRLVEKYFGGIAPGPALDRPVKTAAKLDGEKIVEVNDRVKLERTYLAWPSPAYFDQDDADLELAGTILANGSSARLRKQLMFDRSIATNLWASQYSDQLAGYFYTYVTANPGTDITEIEKLVTDEIARLAKEGPTADELARAKTKWEFAFISSLEYLGGFGGKADTLNYYNTFYGDPGKLESDIARFRNATTESVRLAVDKYLNNKNRVVVRVRPDRSIKSTTPEIDRSKVPAFGAERPFTAPAVKSTKLENGLEIFVVEKPELPKVAISFTTRAGSAMDPAGKGGVASLTNRLIRRGSKTRDPIALDEALGDLGTAITTETGVLAIERSTLNFEVLKRNAAMAANILADVVIDPAFVATEFDREKKLVLNSLAQQEDSSDSLAWRTSGILTYGSDHPYGHPTIGLPTTVQTITRDDVVNFHKTFWNPGNSALIFVGDITIEQATTIARESFGKWSNRPSTNVTIPITKPTGTGKIYLMDKPGAIQSVLIQIMPAPPRNSPDYYPISLANLVYGAGFSTRLNLNLREDKGYAYGAYSDMENFATGGSWYGFSNVQTDKTKESIIEFFKEQKDIAGGRPITEKEFAANQLNKIRGYAQLFESYARVSRLVAALWVARLPMTELQKESDQFAALTLASVNAAAAKYGAPANSSLLVVGDLAKIEAGIRELKLGEIVILDYEGRPKQK
ncbi:MAG: pitrilysin family protein [Pyrinomonadaceae bacterium]|nr:insulinase family protein [Pyrinomonadaceae bacterium]